VIFRGALLLALPASPGRARRSRASERLRNVLAVLGPVVALLVTLFAHVSSAKAAVSMIAPQCDQRGATTFGKAPVLETAQLSIDIGDCFSEDVEDDAPWANRGGAGFLQANHGDPSGVAGLPILRFELHRVFREVQAPSAYASHLHSMTGPAPAPRPPRA
jgi:hypothetical protein